MLFSSFDRLALSDNPALPKEWQCSIHGDHAKVQEHLQLVARTLEWRQRACSATIQWLLVAGLLPCAQVPRALAHKIAQLVYATRNDGSVWDSKEVAVEGVAVVEPWAHCRVAWEGGVFQLAGC